MCIRDRPDTAVIFLTANDMESDMLKGYELGAEDYVTKPFPMSVFQKKLSVSHVGKSSILSDGILLAGLSGTVCPNVTGETRPTPCRRAGRP